MTFNAASFFNIQFIMFGQFQHYYTLTRVDCKKRITCPRLLKIIKCDDC